MTSRSIFITYVPADCGSIIPGKSKAPKAFEDVGIAARLAAAGVEVVGEQYALDAPAAFEAKPFPAGRVRSEELNVSVCVDVHDALANALDKAATEPPSS